MVLEYDFRYCKYLPLEGTSSSRLGSKSNRARTNKLRFSDILNIDPNNVINLMPLCKQTPDFHEKFNMQY